MSNVKIYTKIGVTILNVALTDLYWYLDATDTGRAYSPPLIQVYSPDENRLEKIADGLDKLFGDNIERSEIYNTTDRPNEWILDIDLCLTNKQVEEMMYHLSGNKNLRYYQSP